MFTRQAKAKLFKQAYRAINFVGSFLILLIDKVFNWTSAGSCGEKDGIKHVNKE